MIVWRAGPSSVYAALRLYLVFWIFTAMEEISLKIDEIYVPVKRRQSIDPVKVEQIAESIMEVGQQVPITVRWDGKRHILVSGLQRLEACQALGEETIRAIVTVAAQH